MSNAVVSLPISDVYPNPRHYRELDPANVDRLAAAISLVGQLEPIRVFPNGEIYIVDAGHHRLAAIQKLGLEAIDAIVETEDESSKVMVASNLHFPESELERSRGAQLMFSDGVRPIDAAALIGETDTDKLERAARGLKVVNDECAAEDLTLDRLAAVLDFEGDKDAVEKIICAREQDWRSVHADLVRERAIREKVEELKKLIAKAKVELVEQADRSKMSYMISGDEAPEGAKWARIYVYYSGAMIEWFREAKGGSETPEQAREREAADKRRVELDAAVDRRIAFVVEKLIDYEAGQALRHFAEKLWEDDGEASRYCLGDGPFSKLEGFMPRVTGAILADFEGAAASLLRSPVTPYYLQRNGADTLAYFDALDEAGYEPCDAENYARDAIAEQLDMAEDDEERSCAKCARNADNENPDDPDGEDTCGGGAEPCAAFTPLEGGGDDGE